MDYVIYRFDSSGHIIARCDIDCVSTEEATAVALVLTIPLGGKLEVWRRTAHLATIPERRRDATAIVPEVLYFKRT
jgi:hypothetical protein